MANKSTVAGDLRRFVTFVKGLTDAADTLDQMQSLEETALATEQRVTAAQAALIDVTAQVQAAQQELADVRAKASASVKDAQRRAEDKGAAIVADAELRAVEIVAAANAKAADTIGPALLRHDTLLEQVTSIGDQLVRMTDDKAALDETLAVGQAALAELEGKLAAAREAVAKLLG